MKLNNYFFVLFFLLSFDTCKLCHRSDGTLLFSSATEFTTRLLSRLHENVRDRTINAANELKMMEQTRNISSSKNSIYQDDMENAVIKSVSTTQEDSKIQHYDDRVYEAPMRGESGLAATLKQLRGSNVLNNYEDEIGRTTDERMKCQSNDVGVIDSSQDVNLEYRDSKGRKLTPKEAYRQLCYNFHGYGPGKAKLEKRKEKEEVPFRSFFCRVLFLHLQLACFCGYI